MKLQIWWDLCLVSWREGIVLIFLKLQLLKQYWSVWTMRHICVLKINVFITTVGKKCVLRDWLRWIPRGGIILSSGVCRLMNKSAPQCSTVTILSGLGPEFLAHACNGSVAACTLLFELFHYLSPEIWDVTSDIFAIQNLSIYLAQFSAKWSVG